MLHHTQLLHHVKAVNAWQRRRSAKVELDLADLRLRITANHRYYEFQPQFVMEEEGRIRYRPDLVPEVSGMIGWLPYFNKRWPEGFDKLRFKASMAAAGLPVPRHWPIYERGLRDVLIKQPRNSFGYGMRGPFRAPVPERPGEQLAADEFYEQLIAGSILKTWFFEGTAVCADRREPPMIHGNGHDRVEDLIVRAFDLHQPHRRVAFERARARISDLLAYQGVDWNTVLQDGAPLCADFLYGSCLFPFSGQNLNILPTVDDTPLGEQIRDAGRVMYSFIPAGIRRHTIFSADAVIDEHGRIWWLEMNCNPMMPPETYAPLLDGMFGFAPDPPAAPPLPPRVALVRPATDLAT
jgi:hypothetical protein